MTNQRNTDMLHSTISVCLKDLRNQMRGDGPMSEVVISRDLLQRVLESMHGPSVDLHLLNAAGALLEVMTTWIETFTP